MKKLLSITGSLTLVGVSVSSVISCKTNEQKRELVDLSIVIKNLDLGKFDETPTIEEIISKVNSLNTDWEFILILEDVEIIVLENKAIIKAKENPIYKGEIEVVWVIKNDSIPIKPIEPSMPIDNRKSLSKLIQTNNLGYLKHNIEWKPWFLEAPKPDVIREAIYAKNMHINKEFINSLKVEFAPDQYNKISTEAIITDSTNEFKDEVKVFYNAKNKEEWEIDFENAIDSSDLGMYSLSGDLKTRGSTGLYLYDGSTLNLIDIYNKKSYNQGNRIIDFAWWKNDLYLGITKNNTNELIVFNFVNNEIKELYKITLSYKNKPKVNRDFHWDLIDHIEGNHFSLAKKSYWNGQAGRTSYDSITRIEINELDKTATAHIDNHPGSFLNSTMGIYKTYNTKEKKVNGEVNYHGDVDLNLLRGDKIKVTKYLSNYASTQFPEYGVSFSDLELYRGKNTGSWHHRTNGYITTDKIVMEISKIVKDSREFPNDHYVISFLFRWELFERGNHVGAFEGWEIGDADKEIKPSQITWPSNLEKPESIIQLDDNSVWINTASKLYPIIIFTAQ